MGQRVLNGGDNPRDGAARWPRCSLHPLLGHLDRAGGAAAPAAGAGGLVARRRGVGGLLVGREKVGYEFALKALAGLHTVGPFWWRGWLPFDWGTRSAWEFLAPTLVAC